MKQARIIILIAFCFVISSLFYCNQLSTKAAEPEKLEVLVEGLDSDGDCTLIRYGDIQILIDSARTNGAFDKISEDMNEFMGDDEGKEWEYVIFTHPDADHIGNAVTAINYINASGWSIGTIIDYGKSQGDSSTDTEVKYKEKQDSVCKGSGIAYFAADSLSPDNPVKEYSLSENCKFSILYQNGYNSSDNNSRSVCCLIEFKEQKLLFTGDLDGNGEVGLVKTHGDRIKGVTFFKAGHHGSDSSNTAEFIDVIRPAYVAVTYEQKVTKIGKSLNNFLKYTDYIYPTYQADGYLFGDVSFSFDGKNTEVKTQYNKELEGEEKNIRNALVNNGHSSVNWFDKQLEAAEQLSDEIKVYTFDEKKNSYSNCTLVKYGHYDILIDCGSTETASMAFVNKLKDYVVDGKIEYVIVSHYHVANISQLIGNYKNRESLNDGVLDQFEIGTIIDSGMTNLKDAGESGFYKRYLSKVRQMDNRYSLDANECYEDTIVPGKLAVKIIGSSRQLSEDENDYSLSALITFMSKKMLFVGDTVDYSPLLENHKADISDLKFLRLSNAVSGVNDSYRAFAELARPEYCVIGSALNYRLSNGKLYMGEKMQPDILGVLKTGVEDKIYYCGIVSEHNKYEQVNGDLYFSVKNTDNQKDSEMKCEIREAALRTLGE